MKWIIFIVIKNVKEDVEISFGSISCEICWTYCCVNFGVTSLHGILKSPSFGHGQNLGSSTRSYQKCCELLVGKPTGARPTDSLLACVQYLYSKAWNRLMSTIIEDTPEICHGFGEGSSTALKLRNLCRSQLGHHHVEHDNIVGTQYLMNISQACQELKFCPDLYLFWLENQKPPSLFLIRIPMKSQNLLVISH